MGVLLESVDSLESSSTSEWLIGRLGSHLGEEVAPVLIVDARNHHVVDLWDGEAVGGSGPSLQAGDVDDTREALLQTGATSDVGTG